MAVNTAPELKAALLEMQRQLLGVSPFANAALPQNLHLTLAFIGETSRAEAAKTALSRVGFSPFELLISGFGCFGELGFARASGGKRLESLAAAVRSEPRNSQKVGSDSEPS